MAELIALDMPACPRFVDELQRAWDAGNAVFAVDQHLPPALRARELDLVAPSVVIDADGTTSRRQGRPVEPGDALVVATSGTTGEPKAAVLTHDAVAASARITSRALAVDPARDHWLCCLPVWHIGGLSVVTRALHTGTPLSVHERFDADRVAAAAAAGVTLVSLVVAVLDRLDTSTFRHVLLGGSAMPPELPPNAVASYGMTEAGSGIVYDGYPLEGVELRIVDGEIHLRSPTLLRAYRDGSDPKVDGWLPTGDAGSIGDDGRLSVSGRLADVIVTGAEKVWPVQVEKALVGLGLFREVAVTGRPDPQWGHAVTAIVVPLPDQPVPSVAELRELVAHALPRYALPHAIEIREALPRTPARKIDRTQL